MIVRAWLLLLLLGCGSSAIPAGGVQYGLYSSPDGSTLELHQGYDGVPRGYMRSQKRISAWSPIVIEKGTLAVTTTDDDGTRGELQVKLVRGPALIVGDREFRRIEIERPADAAVRREIEAAYAKLATALETKDYAAFQALRVDEFATIPPDGVPSPGSRMADRARGMIDRIQPPITTTNEILTLSVRGRDAIATVRQKFTRKQMVEGTLHTIHTEVTQRETWTRTADGWKLLFVDEVRDHVTMDDGRRVR
jgi:ketosteroid isomerase-like protein